MTGGFGGLLIVAHLDPKKRGSLEQELAATAAALAARGVPAHLACAREPAHAAAVELAGAGVRWTAIDFARPYAAAREVAALARRLRPSLVHLHFVRPRSPIARAAASTGARVVCNHHVALAPSPSVKRAARHALDAIAAARVDRHVAVSAHVAATVIGAEGVPLSQVEVIPNGVDLARFAPVDRERARRELRLPVDGAAIACVARMAHEKGVDVALRALARLGRDATLLIVGDGPQSGECARLALDLGVLRSVRFLGLRDDVERIYAACDQAWVPSRNEAFGLAAAEAMAAERPVIATRAGGLPEIVLDGETGLLVPVDDADALAAAARSLIDDPDRARALAEAGRARAARLYPIERQVARLVALYEKLVPAWAGAREEAA